MSVESDLIREVSDKVYKIVEDELQRAGEEDASNPPNWMHVVAEILKYMRSEKEKWV